MEHTISDLNAQIERLTHVIEQWHAAERQLEPLEQRLAQLTERGTEVLNHLVDADERRTHAVSEVEARLSEWGAVESRLHQDSLERIRAFEHTIETEWKTLRDLHEEPLKQLREQAAALGETCVAAANLSLRGYERAEARLAALEADLRGQLSQLSRDVQAALAEVRRDQPRPTQIAAASAPFPLDSVMRIHDELRESGKASTDLVSAHSEPPAAPVAPVPEAPRQLSPATTALSDRVESLERELTSEKEEVRVASAVSDRLRRDWRVALAVLVIALLVLGGLGVRFQQSVNARLDEASARAAAAERQAETASAAASREIASARAETAAARDAAKRAEILSGVLAAPDLIRFNLTGSGEAAAAFSQVMWSRSRGLIVSASRLPVAPGGFTYRAWLLSITGPIKAGELVQDSTERATLITENPPDLPRRVTGLVVTLEPPGAGNEPSGVSVLVRAPANPAPSAP